MCTVTNLSKMFETNELVLSMMIDQLEKYGQRSAELLKRIDELTGSSESTQDSEPMSFSDIESDKLNKIFVNIITLLNTGDADCVEASKQYIKSFKSLLQSYPRFKKLEMYDTVKDIYQEFRSSHEGSEYVHVLLDIDTIKNLLYMN